MADSTIGAVGVLVAIEVSRVLRAVKTFTRVGALLMDNDEE